MGVAGPEQHARTFFRAGEVGCVPFAMGHCVENTGTEPPRFPEMVKSDHYAGIPLEQSAAVTPRTLVQAHLHLPDGALARLPKDKEPLAGLAARKSAGAGEATGNGAGRCRPRTAQYRYWSALNGPCWSTPI